MDEKYIKYPFVALRDVVIFPDVTMSLEFGRVESKEAIFRAMDEDKKMIVAAQKDPSVEKPEYMDVYSIGTLVSINQIIQMGNGNIQVIFKSISKIKIETIEKEDELFWATGSEIEKNDFPLNLESVAMIRSLKEEYRIYEESRGQDKKIVKMIYEITDLNILIYQIASGIPVDYRIKQYLYEIENIYEQYNQLMIILSREIEIIKVQNKISNDVKKQLEKNQKDYYLREELKAIYKEMGTEDVKSEADRYLRKTNKLKAPKKVKKKLTEEIKRLRRMNSTSSESAVVRGYIETLLTYPWEKQTEDNLDLAKTQEILDKNHYGLEKIKERIIEYLAVKKLKEDGHSPIICLVGPPGTGKTSIAKSIAQSMGRKYVRVCLGGVRDEAEIRGHRRTYVGAMPGRIVSSIKRVKVNNPVMLFDEIDKMASDYKGDPSAALLEVLDPEQNKYFSDHYVELPVDLSNVLFICTANSLENVERPLLDRMEIINLSGYTENEKFHIAKEHLLPRQLVENGLDSKKIKVSDTILHDIIEYYVSEAGVRSLERKISSMCRKVAKEIALGEAESVSVSARNEKKYLGKRLNRVCLANEKSEIGVVRGMAWTEAGGDTLEIQVNRFPGDGKLMLTGQLGEVMTESAQIAFSYVKSLLDSTQIEEIVSENDFHLHVPEGAVPKDGPSAGVTMATAIYSVVKGKKVLPDIAMTGEITLRGNILAVGGLKEKILAAKTAGINTVFIPWENKRDLEEFEDEILEGIKVCYVKRVEEIWKNVFGGEDESK